MQPLSKAAKYASIIRESQEFEPSNINDGIKNPINQDMSFHGEYKCN